MKIGYFGDGPWAHRSLERLHEDKRNHLRFVMLRYDTQDPSLRRIAEERGIPVLAHPNVNSDEFLAQMREFNCDLLVSMSFNQIIKEPLFSLPPLGFINCHAGGLPFYRGRNPLNWALINDEKKFGVTVHYIDAGIDTGDILRQDWVEITEDDDYAALLKRAYETCPNTLLSAVEDIRAGTAKRISQKTIHPTGFYCGKRREGDEVLDWNWSSRKIHCFVRALVKPGPMARTLCDGHWLAINKTELIRESAPYIGTPGEVISVNSSGFLVKTGDTVLLAKEYEFPEKTAKIRVGTRFGINLHQEYLRLKRSVDELA